MEFQATHKPLYGFHLLQKKKRNKWQTNAESLSSHLYTTSVDGTHLVQLIQRPLQRKLKISITKCQINILTEDGRQQNPAWYWMSQYWCDWFDYVSSHQTTVPLVLSGLLTQTVQLQLVDLEVWPDNKNPITVTSSFSESKAFASCIFSDSPPGSHPLEWMQTEPEKCLLTVSLCVRQRTLHPAARAAGF